MIEKTPWFVARLTWAVLSLAATVSAVADTQQPTPTEPPPRDAITEQAVQIAREIVASFADIEQEQRALLRELGEADRRVAEEQARAERLEREIARLTGQPSAPVAPAVEASPEGAEPPRLPQLSVPPRVVNALGMVESSRRELAEAPAGADALRWTPLVGTLPADGALRVATEAGETRFEHHEPMAEPTVLATLALRDGAVQWRWADLPSSSSQASLARLPWVLAGSTLEALTQGRVVMRWRFEPPTHVVPLRSGRAVASAPPFGDAAPLILEPAGRQPGWVLDAHTPTIVRALSSAAVLTVEWRASTAELVVHSRVGEGLGPHLEQQIAAWEADLTEARLRTPNDRAAIERISAVVAELHRRKAGLDAAAAAAPAGEMRPDYTVELVGDNGAVCARYVIQP